MWIHGNAPHKGVIGGHFTWFGGGVELPASYWYTTHRGLSQEKLPLYLSFFEFVHNARKRGKALLHSLVELLVS